MSAQSHIEKALRDIHMMLSQCEVYDKENNLVIMDKKALVEALRDLSQGIYEVMDEHFKRSESKLKKTRKQCGITQEALSVESGVSLNTIRAYERKSKDLNKAQFDIIMKLAKALKCEVSDLTE